MSFKDRDLCIGQDLNIAKKLIKDYNVIGGIIWGDYLLRIPNLIPDQDPINCIDGPNPCANKLFIETFASIALEHDAKVGLTGDVVLGEDNIKMIFDSLCKSKLYRNAFGALRKTSLSMLNFLKKMAFTLSDKYLHP